MRKLVHPKDVVMDIERLNVVYSVPCADCPTIYVGETKGNLAGGWMSTGKLFRQWKLKSLLWLNMYGNRTKEYIGGHVAILDCSSKLHKRLTLEACHILGDSPSL